MTIVISHQNPSASKPDDVCRSVTSKVHKEPRMYVHAPSLRVPKVGYNEARRTERPVAVVERDVDSCVAETDDVGASITGKICEETRVPVNAPSSGVVAEIVDDEPGRLERAVAVVERDLHACVAEADDVGETIAGKVGDGTRVFVDAPSACAVAEV